MKFTCHGCRGVFESRSATQFCGPCKEAHKKHARIAIGEANKRIRRKEIPKASAFGCVDCSKPASVYDHRSYFEPFVVVPVCHSCNMKRGPALSVVVKEFPTPTHLTTAQLRELGAIAAELGVDIVDASEGFASAEMLLVEQGYFERRFEIEGQSLVNA